MKRRLGYVVHVHDALNYDIDFEFDEEELERWKNVIYKEYQFIQEGDPETKTGRVYRCRLKGVQLFPHYPLGPFKFDKFRKKRIQQKKQVKPALVDIYRLLDRTNGWISCVID